MWWRTLTLLCSQRSILTTPSSSSSVCSSSNRTISWSMVRSALIVLALTAAACHGILPEIADWGINHIVEGPSELDRLSVEQRPEDPQLEPEDAFPQVGNRKSCLHDMALSHCTSLSKWKQIWRGKEFRGRYSFNVVFVYFIYNPSR